MTAPSRVARKAGAGNVFEPLGEAARALGTPRFAARLIAGLKTLIAHDMALIVRYGRASPPDFLVCQGLSRRFVEAYRTSYYTFDPFYLWSRRHRPQGVVTFRDVPPPGMPNSRYRRVFQRQAEINDELGMFLPGVGRESLALFLERSSGWFSAAEVGLARRAYPLFAGLYRAHVDRLLADLASPTRRTDAALARALLLVDRDGVRIAESRAWSKAEAGDPAIAANVGTAETCPDEIPIGENHVLTCERLEHSFALAPGGRIFVLEDASETVSREIVDPVARYWPDLTVRESQIVRLILDGLSSSAIAVGLGISHGTVKNHRARLYEKLGITSERELFLSYLKATGRPGRMAAAKVEPCQ
ncbi:MAG TPA: helix-turn-helix transcriptional regulator [Aestuariivirgaceae bacterium]|nr:helix-turn-helix transcriptional regulator [Aestuariivirgaceae bacterium]